jgi:8-oxo-dGTP diphosphatase
MSLTNSHGAPHRKSVLFLPKLTGTYGLPGGHLDFCETFEAGAARELLEETGLKVDEKEIKFLTATNCILEDKEHGGMEAKRHHFVTVFMGCRIEEGREPKVMEPTKCEGWEWSSWKEVLQDYEAHLEMERTKVGIKSSSGRVIEPGRTLFRAWISLFEQRPGFVPEKHI